MAPTLLSTLPFKIPVEAKLLLKLWPGANVKVEANPDTSSVAPLATEISLLASVALPLNASVSPLINVVLV